MRKTALFFTFVAILTLPALAEAGPKPWSWSWWPSHWKDQKFQPHIENPKEPHNSQWKAAWNPDHEWTPESWVNAEGSAETVIVNLYRQGILVDQDEDGDMLVLVVGDGFMNLSGEEKRRVAEFVDYAFGVTERNVNPMFYLYYDRTDGFWSRGEPIGVYTQGGLQLQ